jgi:hypothetical protein
MTVSVTINGIGLFEWTGTAAEVGNIDGWVRALARDKGVTPELVAQRALVDVLTDGRLRAFTRRDAILLWMLLTQPTHNPDRPGFYRDYIEVWDFDFDVSGDIGAPLRVKVGGRMQCGGRWKRLN